MEAETLLKMLLRVAHCTTAMALVATEYRNALGLPVGTNWGRW